MPVFNCIICAKNSQNGLDRAWFNKVYCKNKGLQFLGHSMCSRTKGAKKDRAFSAAASRMESSANVEGHDPLSLDRK